MGLYKDIRGVYQGFLQALYIPSFKGQGFQLNLLNVGAFILD